MSETTPKPPKKEKERRQTPEERQQALRYNHMMYGLTANEKMRSPRKVDYGAPYLAAPKFQALIAAFKKASVGSFEVTQGGRSHSVTTEEGQISFNGKVFCYTRHLNRFEDNLLVDLNAALQFEESEVFVHLLFAILRSFPELGAPRLVYGNRTFYLDGETLKTAIQTVGPNLLMGSFPHGRVVQPKARP